MPIGYYIIEFAGNELFMPSSKQINILNENNDNQVKIYLGLRERIDTAVTFMFLKTKNGKECLLKEKKVCAKAIYLSG
jgi:hypothetical protein